MKKAFTLVEMLTVIGIIVIVAAISYPALVSARKSANRTRCISNLHQLWTVVALYRADQQSAADTGNLYEMGLPTPDYLDPLLPKPPLKCPEDTNIPGTLNGYDYYPQEPKYHLPMDWQDYVKIAGQSAVLWSDFNHNTKETLELLQFPKFALGVTLSGSAVKRSAPGEPVYMSWWLDGHH